MNQLADEQKKELKKLRFMYADLGTASLMKEYLRNIYGMAAGVATARVAFTLWREKAEAFLHLKIYDLPNLSTSKGL